MTRGSSGHSRNGSGSSFLDQHRTESLILTHELLKNGRTLNGNRLTATQLKLSKLKADSLFELEFEYNKHKLHNNKLKHKNSIHNNLLNLHALNARNNRLLALTTYLFLNLTADFLNTRLFRLNTFLNER